MIYRKNKSQPFKWLLALIIFILAMTITFDEVFGISVPPPGGGGSDGNPIVTKNVQYNKEAAGTQTTPSIPEPGTLLLLGTGFGALYIMRRKKL